MSKKKIHIYYFSTALSDEIYDEIVGQCKRFKPTFSGVGFDRNIAIGLSEQVKITGISLYPIPSFPKFNKLRQESHSYTIGDFTCTIPNMISLPVVKEYNYGLAAYHTVKRIMRDDEENVILISGLYRSLIRPAKWLKKRFRLPIIAIVPDIPELMITYRKDYSMLRNIFNKIDMQRSIKYRSTIDAFIVLSSFMNPVVNKYNRPWTVIDGLCNLTAIDQAKAEKSKERFILYAGKVTSTFGIDKLVDAFLKAKLKNTKLVICGDGDYAPTLRKKAAIYQEIDYKGTVSHSTVLSLEKSAILLVDPRPIDNEIAKMSFPSKIIEYMASGTPVLVSNIPSFSPEYRQYQYRIEEVTTYGIEKSLREVFKNSDEELKKKGSAARQFILENKTIHKQCEKIIDFIHSVIR